jgi:uncharacterized repeat protein (TIGR01451 family)
VAGVLVEKFLHTELIPTRMKRLLAGTLLMVLLLFLGVTCHAAVSYGKLPLSFEENVGQTDDSFRFMSRGSGYGLFLGPSEVAVVLRSQNPSPWPSPTGRGNDTPLSSRDRKWTTVRMKLEGAVKAPEITGDELLPGTVNYFSGDQSQWRRNIATYGRVKYSQVYPGIDLVFYGSQRQLEYDFMLAPGANPQRIAWRFEGVERIEIDDAGELVLHLPDGEVRQHKPIIYQDIDGVRKPVAGGYTLRNHKSPEDQQEETEGTESLVGFWVGEYDRMQPLVIDPVLQFSTYFGGSGGDNGNAIKVDTNGANVYIVGDTTSANFPADGTYRGGQHGFDSDAFVIRLAGGGQAVYYATYLGGNGGDSAQAVTVDDFGSVYLTGYTFSTDFPVANAYQSQRANPNAGGPPEYNCDVFVTRLNIFGQIVYSTYLGGFDWDFGYGIAVNRFAEASVTGDARGGGFPAHNSLYPGNFSGCFIARFSSGGNSLLSCTIIPGTGPGAGVAIDPLDNIYLTGSAGPGFPRTAGAFQTTNMGDGQGFAMKLNSQASQVLYATFLGGTRGTTTPRGIAVDASGNAYLTGATWASDFPTMNAIQPALNGANSGAFGTDAFVTKLNATGSALVYSTFLGGIAGDDEARAIAIDSTGSAYIAGATMSADLPTANSMQSYGGSGDAFVAKLSASGSGRHYVSYLGGSGGDTGYGISVDGRGSAYVAGTTGSGNFPTVFPRQGANAGGNDAFVSKIGDVLTSQDPPDFAISANAGTTYDTSVKVSPGQSRAMTLTVRSVGGFSSPVTFACANLPTGVTCAFSANPASPPADGTTNVTLTISASAGATAGYYGFELSATTSTLRQALRLFVDVPDFKLHLGSRTAAVVQGRSTNVSVRIESLGGYDDPLTLAAMPLPGGVTMQFSPNPVPTNYPFVNRFSTGTVNVDSNAAPGTYTVGISAMGGALSHTTNLTLTVLPAVSADLSLTKTHSQDPAVVGSPLQYLLTVLNKGPVQATGIVLSDRLPDGAQFVSMAASQGSASRSNDIVTVNFGTLASNATATLTVNVTPMRFGLLTNSAIVLASEPDNVPGNNSTNLLTRVVPRADQCFALTAGMVAWWNGQGTTQDLVNFNHGRLIGGYTSGKVGQSFAFDGVNNYFLINDHATLTPPELTVEFWFKSNVSLSGSVFVPLLMKMDLNDEWAVTAKGYNIYYGFNGLYFTVATTSGGSCGGANCQIIGANRSFAAGTWYHVAGTYSSAGQRLYVDGALFASANFAGPIGYSPAPIQVGRVRRFNPVFFNGQIDEISIYNRALNAAEIAAIHFVGSSGKCPISLALQRSGTRSVLSWPGAVGTNYAVQAAQTIGNPINWMSVPGLPVIQGERNVLTNENGAASTFYRLRKP